MSEAFVKIDLHGLRQEEAMRVFGRIARRHLSREQRLLYSENADGVKSINGG